LSENRKKNFDMKEKKIRFYNDELNKTERKKNATINRNNKAKNKKKLKEIRNINLKHMIQTYKINKNDNNEEKTETDIISEESLINNKEPEHSNIINDKEYIKNELSSKKSKNEDLKFINNTFREPFVNDKFNNEENYTLKKPEITTRRVSEIQFDFKTKSLQKVSYDISSENTIFPTLNTQTEGLPDWWSNQTDNDLLIGTYKYGFGVYDQFITDQNLSFYGALLNDDSERPAKRSRRSTSSYSSSKVILPETSVLNTRVEALLDILSDPVKSNSGRLHVWSKAERHTLRITFQSYGLPSTQEQWKFLVNMSGIHTKTTEQIKEYCEELLERANSEALLTKKKPVNKKGGAYDDDEFSPQIAKTLLSRINLFNCIRQIPATVDSRRIIAGANLPPLAYWWGEPQDMFLIQCVQANGIIKKAWDVLLTKPNVFTENCTEEEKMTRNAYISSFLTQGKKEKIQKK